MYKLMEDILYYRIRLAFAERVNKELVKTDKKHNVEFWKEQISKTEQELYSELANKYRHVL